MAINPDIRIKVRHFFQDHYKAIIIVVVVFVLIVLINRFLISRRYSRNSSNNLYAKCCSLE